MKTIFELRIEIPGCTPSSLLQHRIVIFAFFQGILVSIFSISGNLSRILGPTLFTSIYFVYGPKGAFGLLDVGIYVALMITLVFYKRLVPYQDFLAKKSGASSTKQRESIKMKKHSKQQSCQPG